MARFKISLKLTGLEVEIEGSRDDVPLMTQAVGQQLAGLFMPAANIVEGDFSQASMPQQATLPQLESPTNNPSIHTKKSPPQPRKRSIPGAKNSRTNSAEAIDWVHDPEKWGAPKQEWNTATKAIWLIYVASRESNVGEFNAHVITATFNKHFRQSGQILPNNVNRDLGKLKAKSPALVAQDTTKEIEAWFLTQSGNAHAEKLVADALGRSDTVETKRKD